MTFKEGDKIRMLGNCSGNEKGNICTLHFGSRNGSYKDYLFAWEDSSNGCGCTCQSLWELVPAEKTWDTLEVGDVIVDFDGDVARVLAVIEDVFLRSNGGDFDITGFWMTKTEAKLNNITIKQPSPPPQPQILELTLDEIAKKFEVEQVKIKKE